MLDRYLPQPTGVEAKPVTDAVLGRKSHAGAVYYPMQGLFLIGNPRSRRAYRSLIS
jgi:hypothetical protein